jgi:ubiquinone/menaquinone biosynthesis C-methylase UbiE
MSSKPIDRSLETFGSVQLMATEITQAHEVAVPGYLQRIYWWTYIHPLAVWVFDRQWVVNLILLTQYNRMRSAALSEFEQAESGRVLQISCAYGDLTPKLVSKIVNGGGQLDIIDVLPIQLKNTRRKLPASSPVRLLNMNANDLGLPSASYDKVLIFFLLHEIPPDVRLQTLEEAFRVLKPGGKLVLADFAMPKWWNPFRYLWAIFLTIFEPFALDMWRWNIHDLMPRFARPYKLQQNRYFGALFQKTVITKPVL